jgi:hypothetical protein
MSAVPPGKGSRKKNGPSLWIRQAALSYIRDFGLLGGVLALLVNEGFTGTGHLFLAVHGYVWHILLILLSLSIGLPGRRAAKAGKAAETAEITGAADASETAGTAGAADASETARTAGAAEDSETDRAAVMSRSGSSRTFRGPLPNPTGAPGTRFRDEALLFLFTAALAEGINVLLHPFGDCDMFYISPYHLSSQPVFHEIDALVGRPAGILIYLAAVLLGAWLVRRIYQLLGAA